MKKLLLVLLLLFPFSLLFAQTYNPLWDDSKINSVYITIDTDSLSQLYTDINSDHKFPVRFIYNYGTESDTLQNVGLRLRGNTSRGAAKKSFKIDFNNFVKGRTYFDETEINLNGSHNDASMIREKLFYDVWKRMGMPERKTAFADVYINGDYYGLYINMKEYDELFLQNTFGNSTGNLYKCTYPADLKYFGNNQDSYKTIQSADGDRAYDLKTNTDADDYSDLINLTKVINETDIADLPCELEKIFDVDLFLKAYALDVSSGNWDNYSYNKNNYYLYNNPATGKFIFLAYDCDNTFGIDWVGKNWATRNIYNWNNSDYALTERIMQVQEYKDRFSFYLDELVNGVLLPANISPRIDSLKNLIAPSALLDEYRTYDYGYTYNDFLNSFNTNDVDGHTPYGIKNFITARRTSTLTQLDPEDILPVIRDEKISPAFPSPGITENITVTAFDDSTIQSVTLKYTYDSVYWYTLNMSDDGAHNDGAAGDHIYGGGIAINQPGEIWYYFLAGDGQGNTARYPFCDDHLIMEVLPASTTGVVINEFMAQNNAGIQDDFGEYEDWIELFNPTSDPVYLGDKFITDNAAEPGKWQLPDTTLLPGSYILLWADEDTDQGSTHADIKLSAGGEFVGVYSIDGGNYSAIDSITFGAQQANISFGRYPNGTGPFTAMMPTPEAVNQLSTFINAVAVENVVASLTNNPTHNVTGLQFEVSIPSQIKVGIYSIEGRHLMELFSGTGSRRNYIIPIDCSAMAAGTYIINISAGNTRKNLKLVVF